VTDLLQSLAVRRVPPDQLQLDVTRLERLPAVRHDRRRRRGEGEGRLALSPDEAAAVLGVSRDYFDEHVISELRVVRRGRRILVALAELERWLDRSATSATVGRRA
jgi:excisionase family DNA binding protein